MSRKRVSDHYNRPETFGPYLGFLVDFLYNLYHILYDFILFTSSIFWKYEKNVECQVTIELIWADINGIKLKRKTINRGYINVRNKVKSYITYSGVKISRSISFLYLLMQSNGRRMDLWHRWCRDKVRFIHRYSRVTRLFLFRSRTVCSSFNFPRFRDKESPRVVGKGELY